MILPTSVAGIDCAAEDCDRSSFAVVSVYSVVACLKALTTEYTESTE